MATKKDTPKKDPDDSPAVVLPDPAPSTPTDTSAPAEKKDGPSLVQGKAAGPAPSPPSRDPNTTTAEHWAFGKRMNETERAAFVRWASKKAPAKKLLAAEWEALFKKFMGKKFAKAADAKPSKE